jgi:hypothetical protein
MRILSAWPRDTHASAAMSSNQSTSNPLTTPMRTVNHSIPEH